MNTTGRIPVARVQMNTDHDGKTNIEVHGRSDTKHAEGKNF